MPEPTARDGEIIRLCNRCRALEANGNELLVRAERAEATEQRVREVVCAAYGEDYAGEDTATEVERLMRHEAEHEANVQRILQAKNAAIERAQTERDHAEGQLSALRDHRARWEMEHAEVERLRAELAKANAHRERLADFQVATIERNQELLAERDALKAAIERVETDAIEQQKQTGVTLDRWKLGVYAQASRTRRILRDALAAPESPATAPTPVTAATEAHGGAGEAQGAGE